MRFGIRGLLLTVALIGAGLSWWCWPQATRLQHTGRELDLALVGPGFFQIEDLNTNERFYTRHGSLIVNANGGLAIGRSSEMMFLSPNIHVPMDEVTIEVDRNGNVRCRQFQSTILSDIGAISVTRFVNPDELREVRPGLFAASEGSGVAWSSMPGQNGAGYVLQGWLEQPRIPGDPADRFDLLRWATVMVMIWLVYQVGVIRRQLDRLCGPNA